MSRTLLISLACLAVVVLAGIFSYYAFFNPMPTSSANNIAVNTNINLNTNTGGANVIGIAASTSNPDPKPISAVKAKTSPVKKAVAISATPISTGKEEIMAWIYPGSPTCGAKSEYSDGRKIDILKPEYFTISDTGQLTLLTEATSGCNGYSPANVASLKKYSKAQYATFSSSYAVTMDQFLTDTINNSSNIDTLVSFAVDNKLTGIEIDFEDFGGWDAAMYSKYKQFITSLGDALHKNNKKLMVDGPATSNAVEQAWYVWRYADFNSLPVDRLVVMTYDYQFDQGSGQPVSPISWIQNTIKWTRSQFTNKAKLSFGIPSYGYKGIAGSQKFSLLTYDQIKKEPGFDTAQRDPGSFEMTWQDGDNVYFYQDGSSMSKKLQTIQNAGIASVSVWHLGGNLWFAKN